MLLPKNVRKSNILTNNFDFTNYAIFGKLYTQAPRDGATKNEEEKIMTNITKAIAQANIQETGAVKTVCELGRIQIPLTLRQAQGIEAGDQFEFLTQGTTIMMVRHAPSCLACDDDTDVQRLHRTFLCGECREALKKG